MSSIRRRLLLLLVPFTAGALALTAFGIHRAVYRDLRGARDRQLLLLAQGIASAVDVEVDGSVEFELYDEDMAELRESVRETFYAVFDAAEGELLFSSSPPPEGLFRAGGDEPAYLDTVVGGRKVRLAVISILRDPAGDVEDREEWLAAHPGARLPEAGPRRFLVAAGEADNGLEETMMLVRRRLFAGFALLGTLLVIVPTAAAVLSLRPLERLSKQAERVSAANPGARLGEEDVDREVLSLVRGLNRALDRLGIALDQQKRLTADAAHELRSPLSAIRAQCEVGLRRERSKSELEEALRSIHRATLRLSAVVENLLSLARLEGGSQVVAREPVDLARTAGEAVHLLSPLAETRGVQLRERIRGPVPVAGDGILLLECLSILLDNAIRYTPEGGLITVSAGNGPRAWLTVADTGIGIPAAQLDRIFERFHRVEPSRSLSDGGSGLGLSIAETIARLHGAEITVTSTPGEGSRFTLLFPRQES